MPKFYDRLIGRLDQESIMLDSIKNTMYDSHTIIMQKILRIQKIYDNYTIIIQHCVENVLKIATP